jgi:hypothetical protein
MAATTLAGAAQPGLGRLPQVAGQLQQQPAGGLGVAGERRRPDHAEGPRGGGVGDGDEQQLAPATRDLVEPPPGQGEEVVPADEHR